VFSDIFTPRFNHVIKLCFKGWLVYFIVFNIYCIFWRQYGVGMNYDYIDSLIWWAKEWLIWVIITPIILFSHTYFLLRQSLKVAVTVPVFFFLFVVIVLRVALEYQQYEQELATLVFALLPKYAITYLLILSVWYYAIYLGQRLKNNDNPVNEDSYAPLMVEHLGLNKKIAVEDIYVIKACGNYVEICCQEAEYLKRATLKQLIDELPQSIFIQVHRSHLVNINKIQRLTNAESGTGLLTLNNSKTLSVSKKYKTQLKNQLVN